MCLLEMKAGERALIDSINVKGELRKRLYAMGVMNNSDICIKQFGWFKSTVQIMINSTLIAIRRNEAELIEVHKI